MTGSEAGDRGGHHGRLMAGMIRGLRHRRHLHGFVLSLPQDDRLHHSRWPTTPADPAEAVLAGFARLLGEAGVAAGASTPCLHATTVATNALSSAREADGADHHQGFRDVLIIGRAKRYENTTSTSTSRPRCEASCDL